MPEAGRAQLAAELEALIGSASRPSRSQGIVIPAEYLEVVIER